MIVPITCLIVRPKYDNHCPNDRVKDIVVIVNCSLAVFSI